LTRDLEDLCWAGTRLDCIAEKRDGRTLRDLLIEVMLRIRDKHGRLRPLRANRAQAEFSRRAGRRNIVLKARQLGITTWIAARFFLATITRPGTVSVQVAHDQNSAEEIFRIVHRFLANLPDSLRKGALETSRANVRQIVFPHLDSEYRVETAADPNAGRGLTIHHLHASEVARWPGDAAATLASLCAAVPPHGEVALESTPAGAGGCFYDEWQRADETATARHFFPWWWEPEYARPDVKLGRLTDDERELVAEHGLGPAQIAYRREMRANFRGLAPQEFAEDAQSCFLASGDCVFDVEAIQRRLNEIGEPAEARDNGRLLIFWPPARNHRYIVGVDPAGGGAEGDYAVAQVIDRETAMQCAELHGHFTPYELAAEVAKLAREYNQALVAVERNNHGHGVIAHLTTSGRYTNLFSQGESPGWNTNAATRPAMLEGFAAILMHAPQLFWSRRLLEECRTFVRGKDGSTRAAAGAHDDCIFAMAIALAVRKQETGSSRSRTIEMGSLPER
jgi:hypothetical protein